MSYAAIIIGSGQAGGPLAMAFANAGKKTALIEEAHIGGTCINEGCECSGSFQNMFSRRIL
jgi:pyruvate/2-oxoglutarate dehydrogenase complex dihydrolipoamide dehydrogenase (E3) component